MADPTGLFLFSSSQWNQSARPPWQMSKSGHSDAGQRAVAIALAARQSDEHGRRPGDHRRTNSDPGPREGETYRWKVQHGRAEKHVYVQIADSLKPESFEDPLRSGIITKGESVLRKLLERGNVPTRIKITSAGSPKSESTAVSVPSWSS